MFSATLAHAQHAPYCAHGASCDDDVVAPSRKFDLEILIRPVPKVLKPKVVVKPTKTVNVVKKPVLKTIEKTAVVQKKPTAKPIAKKVPIVRKPFEPKPSWLGLPEIPVTILLAEDFNDIAGQYIIDLNAAAFAAAGLDLLTISPAELAGRLGIQPGQIRSIQRQFLLSVVLRATPEQAAALARNPLVLTVHADTKIKAAGGSVPLSWGLDRLDSPALPLDGVFNRDFGGYASRIYLFDQGVDRGHGEFEKRIKFGASFIDALPHRSGKCREHGTEMAALIAGASTGTAPRAEVVELVVLPCSRNETGEASSLIEAAEWLLIREADFGDGKPVVANMSLTGKWSRKINSAVSVLTKNGVAVVVAAGNNAQDACRFSPASAKDAVTVAATDASDKTPGFSNYGQCVDIHAPGRLLTTATEGKPDHYVVVNGTSGAAALVSGLLARSLKAKGAKAADQWLKDAGAPAQYWRKDQKDAVLAQASSRWRTMCRLGGDQPTVPLRFRPTPVGDAFKQLPKNALVNVESIANQWARVSVFDGTRGWVAIAKSSSPTLLEIDRDSICSVIR